jgi:hypothetical protein
VGSDAIRLRARVVLRERWRAAVGLGVVAAIGGGLVLSLAMIAKDTGSAVDTYVARADAPEGFAVYCPPGTDREQPDVPACLRYDPVRERAALADRPDVVAAARGAPTPVFIRPQQRAWTEAFAWVAIDDIQVYGKVDLVAGRLARPDTATEVTVNEGFVRQHGLHVGDRFDLAPITWQEFDASSPGTIEPASAPTSVEIAGVVRTPTDLTVAVENNDALSVNEAALFLGPAWVRAVGQANFARYQNGLIVDVVPGADPLAVLRSASPGVVSHSSAESLVEGEIGALEDVVSYEARAAWAAAALSALAIVVFVGQMLARQARRELDDALTLRSIGATTNMLVRSSLPRWLVSAGVAVARRCSAHGAAVVARSASLTACSGPQRSAWTP